MQSQFQKEKDDLSAQIRQFDILTKLKSKQNKKFSQNTNAFILNKKQKKNEHKKRKQFQRKKSTFCCKKEKTKKKTETLSQTVCDKESQIETKENEMNTEKTVSCVCFDLFSLLFVCFFFFFPVLNFVFCFLFCNLICGLY